jgi:hypothetical protein
MERENMKPSDYLVVQAKLAMVVQVLRFLSLEEFLDAAQHAETVCPFMDPTLYGAAGRRLAEIIHLARAADDFLESVGNLDDIFLESLQVPLARDGRPTPRTEDMAMVPGLLFAAELVEGHWNYASTMVSQKQQAVRSGRVLRQMIIDIQKANGLEPEKLEPDERT